MASISVPSRGESRVRIVRDGRLPIHGVRGARIEARLKRAERRSFTCQQSKRSCLRFAGGGLGEFCLVVVACCCVGCSASNRRQTPAWSRRVPSKLSPADSVKCDAYVAKTNVFVLFVFLGGQNRTQSRKAIIVFVVRYFDKTTLLAIGCGTTPKWMLRHQPRITAPIPHRARYTSISLQCVHTH